MSDKVTRDTILLPFEGGIDVAILLISHARS